MAQPAIAVFDTPELLEMIFLEIGPHATDEEATRKRKERLDKIQGASKTFQQTIERSIHIQRARFLAHAPTLETAEHGLPVINPLLESFIIKMGADIWKYDYDDQKPTHLTLHIKRLWDYEGQESYKDLRDLEEDSWRQLKVTASELNIEVALRRDRETNWMVSDRCYDLPSTPGDFGALFDLIEHACDNCTLRDDGIECRLCSDFGLKSQSQKLHDWVNWNEE